MTFRWVKQEHRDLLQSVVGSAGLSSELARRPAKAPELRRNENGKTSNITIYYNVLSRPRCASTSRKTRSRFLHTAGMASAGQNLRQARMQTEFMFFARSTILLRAMLRLCESQGARVWPHVRSPERLLERARAQDTLQCNIYTLTRILSIRGRCEIQHTRDTARASRQGGPPTWRPRRRAPCAAPQTSSPPCTAHAAHRQTRRAAG